jgi:hypothetical protein
MISQPPRDKEGDLVTQGFEEEPKTIDLTIKAEGIIASAFYLLYHLERSNLFRFSGS